MRSSGVFLYAAIASSRPRNGSVDELSEEHKKCSSATSPKSSSSASVNWLLTLETLEERDRFIETRNLPLRSCLQSVALEKRYRIRQRVPYQRWRFLVRCTPITLGLTVAFNLVTT